MTDADGVPYRERLDEILLLLVRHGSMALLLIDLLPAKSGGARLRLQGLRKGSCRPPRSCFETCEVERFAPPICCASSDKGGDAFLVFLSPKRTGGPARIAELEAAARIENYFNQRLSKLASPYVRQDLKVPVGYSFVLHNPLVMPERLVTRLVDEAWECVRYQQLQRAFKSRAQVLEIILNDNLKTLFQPIFRMDTNEVMGCEALSRGPEGTEFHSPLNLFEGAAQADLVFELDRACRLRALRSGQGLSEPTKLFINILPSSMYDPDFHGSSLLDLLEQFELAPEQIVLEITEKYAIENYSLFGGCPAGC